MIGILADVLSVMIGGILGARIGRRLPAGFAEKMNRVFGVCAVGMGVFSVIPMENMPAVVLALTLGSLFGLLCRVGRRIDRGAVLLERSLRKKLLHAAPSSDEESDSSLLVTALVLFCASGTGIYGALEAGMTGSQTILLSKAVLDLFTAMIFACAAGIGISAVALPQLLVFLLLFFSAKLILPLTTPQMIRDFKACGGFILIATGLRIAGVKEFPIADMLPSLLLVMPFSSLWTKWIAPLLS